MLSGHLSQVWGLAVSSRGEFAVSCSADRSLRRWERQEEVFFVEEEREARLESMFDAQEMQVGAGVLGSWFEVRGIS